MNAPPESRLLRTVSELTDLSLQTYAVNPARAEEDANGERRIHQGGYGDRQVFELVQNASDALRGHPGGRIHVVLTKDHLYCANEGEPLTPEGADTILRMGVSKKRSGEVGRFGVGVKSVLSVTDCPEFFTREHGSFGFDANWSRAMIRQAIDTARAAAGLPDFALGDTPVLRLARPLNTARERLADPVLDELLTWAATVVRLPLPVDKDMDERLRPDLHQSPEERRAAEKEFPRLFPLFSNHVGVVRLEDRRSVPFVTREITVQHEGAKHTVHESRGGAQGHTEHYRVFTVPHEVSAAAREGAGELHRHATIDVSWAVPEYTEDTKGHLQVPHSRGAFWSFFPTKYPTTLRGALNAAWKTNEDRQNLLDGSDLNEELIGVAAGLVVDSLPQLVEPADPAAYLPLLPGRSKESPNWACAMLTEQVWELAAVRPSLPDQDGVLRSPADLRIHPEPIGEKLGPEVLELWAAHPGRPADWVHRSVEVDRDRRGKMNHILGAAGRQRAEVREWLEALVEDRTPKSSAAAVRVLATVIENASSLPPGERIALVANARSARIVLTSDHGFAAPGSGRVFRRTGADGLADDHMYVHEAIASDPDMTPYLEAVGIHQADAEGRFHNVLDKGFAGYDDDAWTRFWELQAEAHGAARASVLLERIPQVEQTLKVRTMDGRFRLMIDCLLPGEVVPGDGSRDAAVAVDLGFHDRDVLRELGMGTAPGGGHDPRGDEWFDGYHAAIHTAYCEGLEAKARRVQLQTVVLSGREVAGPLHLFDRLSPLGRAAFLDALPPEALVPHWTRQIGGSVRTRTKVVSPILWLLRDRGTVRTSLGVVPVAEAVGPELAPYARVLPVTDLEPDKASRLGLPSSVESVRSELWAELLQKADDSEDDELVGSTYALLVEVAPALLTGRGTVRCRVGTDWELRPASEAALATSREDYEELIHEKHPALLVDSPEDHTRAELLIAKLGLRRVSEVIEKQVRAVPAGDAEVLTALFPVLRQRFGRNRVEGLQVQRCTELEEVVRTPNGTRLATLRHHRQDRTLLVLFDAGQEEVLLAADAAFGFGLGTTGRRDLLESQRRQQENEERQEALARIRAAEDPIDKIGLLIGEEKLRLGLPAGLIEGEPEGTQPDARRIAELAYHAHGYSILRVHAKDISARHEDAPPTFDGLGPALRFVADLGFPDAFAGARLPSPPAREEIHGPRPFPPLHTYQERLASKFTELLSFATPQRAMLTLPTGAGKTRVTAEAVIRWIRASGTPTGPILWIAQTDELCEQAVQSWKFVWTQVGADQPLVIDRLWKSNAATPVTGRPHLVVATDAKLAHCLHTDEYAWLREASLVLIDEAHVAISPEYTRLLEGLGLTHRETPRHLVGLTATPFRNDTDLTRRLVQRFGNRRLDEGIFLGEPIPYLQSIGVLAEVEHRELAGAAIRLEDHEVDAVEQFGGFLPKKAEQRLAEDAGRNRMLLDEIAAMPADWPVLVFATSVAHAGLLAAKLNDMGISAASVDSSTPSAVRRKQVEDFRSGKLRVITNYGVLSQGFDAPATRAVVIARPVFSANAYQQMIGRGLRGESNGGKNTCLILDVRDNIANFRKDLAFTDFEYLWRKDVR
ncbi:DEAD/DEAH box helicase family protein [Streptomyces sp. NPDC031705]|uniref:DEAD/DEAH box helicase n=1 Tax=Streptomyces sp. NPDC031705 TaxID=3155729 RepID=UPI0033F373B4